MAREVRIHLQEDFTNKIFPFETELSETDTHHLHNVLRLKSKTAIRLFDESGKEYRGILLPRNGKKLRVRILEKVTGDWCQVQTLSQGRMGLKPLYLAPIPSDLILFQSPPRGGRMDALIRPLGELGTDLLIPLLTERTIVRLSREDWKKKGERWKKMALESAKQSGRKIPMKIGLPLDFSKALEETANIDLGLILLPHAEDSFSLMDFKKIQARISKPLRIGLFVGPEGGFSVQEISQAMNKGLKPFCLHANILRCETAPIAALAVLQFMVSLPHEM